ncbi:MAG: NADH-ubiquinone oxidoreductase-F iron-sulfur binding region domain-containing protein [Oscillospiraceae bacterium]|nr:NADH-ubiquinone oxidoreductase-F iron-sulfur binding region domain-containing protein [Oscillospiraceae bacterium]
MYSWINDKNLTPDQVRKAVQESGIRESGELLSDRIGATVFVAKKSGFVPGVVCALYNSDTRGALLSLLKDDPEKILKGIALAGVAVEANNAYLYIPDFADDLASSLEDLCGKYNVKIERGIVDVREREGSLLIHITTAADLADCAAGEFKPGVYVSVDGAAAVKADAGTAIGELLDVSGAKAILAGKRILSTDDAGMTVEEAAPSDGYIHAIGASECIVKLTSDQLTESGKQSCGKCVFCREGLIQLQFMHKEMTSGRGKQEYLDLIKEIGEGMCISTPCTMGQQSALTALTALDKYESIYKDHIKKKCSVCFSKEAIYIDPKLCQGCEECADVCPKDCIEGKAKFIHMIDDFDCDLCGKCIEACEYDAIIKTTGKLPKLPNRLTKVGKFKR